MSTICDADLQYLKPGKKIVLKTFNGIKLAPVDVNPAENYWLLIGSKAVVVTTTDDNIRALVKFDRDLSSLGLVDHNKIKNALWVFVSDLKFVCRY